MDCPSIDALRIIREELVGKQLLDAAMDRTTGDLRFRFDDDLLLEVFNFTGFEIWAATFPYANGVVQLRSDETKIMISRDVNTGEEPISFRNAPG